MANKKKKNSYKSSSSRKGGAVAKSATGVIVTIVVFVLILALTIASAYGSEGWRQPIGQWFDNWGKGEITLEEEPTTEETYGGLVISPTASPVMEFSTMRLARAAFAANAVPETAESAYEVTVTPGGFYGADTVRASLKFKNSGATWATDKDVNDYATVQEKAGETNVYVISCLQAFGEPIEVVFRVDTATCSVQLDYVKAATIKANTEENNGNYPLVYFYEVNNSDSPLDSNEFNFVEGKSIEYGVGTLMPDVVAYEFDLYYDYNNPAPNVFTLKDGTFRKNAGFLESSNTAKIESMYENGTVADDKKYFEIYFSDYFTGAGDINQYLAYYNHHADNEHVLNHCQIKLTSYLNGKRYRETVTETVELMFDGEWLFNGIDYDSATIKSNIPELIF